MPLMNGSPTWTCQLLLLAPKWRRHSNRLVRIGSALSRSVVSLSIGSGTDFFVKGAIFLRLISSLFLGYARRYFVDFFEFCRFLPRSSSPSHPTRPLRSTSSPSHPTRPLRSVSSPCLKPCSGTSSLGRSQTSSRRRSCCATTSATWADRMQCAAQRCCALILSYMTERVMTFVVCVSRGRLESRHYFRKFLSLLQQGIL